MYVCVRAHAGGDPQLRADALEYFCSCSGLCIYNNGCCTIQLHDAGGDPQLWAEALEYFCSRPGDCSAAISQVLAHIEQRELLPPLVVLQTLAKNKTLKVRSSRDMRRVCGVVYLCFAVLQMAKNKTFKACVCQEQNR
jgi:hypothetical protein